MQRLLRSSFREMSAIVAAHGGIVEKYIGDAILAIFGLPVAHANDAEHALRAADACVRWSAAAVADGSGLAVRAGVETGELLVDLAAVETKQAMVVGESINTASRLQNAAEPGQVVVGPVCREAADAVAEFKGLGTLSLKGLGDIDGWLLTGFNDAGRAFQVEFVGREKELTALRGAFERARDGSTVFALIVGQPGQGKSRLAAEAIRQGAPAAVLEGRCRPGTETGANTPLRQLVESDLPDATADAVHERLNAMVGAADGARIAAAICHSTGLAADEQLLAITRYEQRELIAIAWARYLEGMTADGPITVMVEDVHWADPVLLRVIDHVTTELRAPLIVLATARPEFLGTADLRPGAHRVQIDLGPLEASDVERLVQLAGDGMPTGGAAFDRAGGNPLFLIELARSRSRPSELPVTIQAAIGARLDELAPNERELLQAASVAGETFELRDAALLAERDPGEVVAALGRFAHLGFVMQVGGAYRFHHILVRDVAYGRLPVVERRRLHARFATAGTDPDDAEAQAHHWWEALKPPDAAWVWEDEAQLPAMRHKAYRAHMTAGARLEQRNAYEEATDLYLRAIDLADASADRAEAFAAAGRGFARQGRGDDAWTNRLQAISLYGEASGHAPALLYADLLELATFNWGYFHKLPDDAEVLRLLDAGADLARAEGDEVALTRLLAERAAFTGDASGSVDIHPFLDGPDAVRFGEAAQRLGSVYVWTGRIGAAQSLFEAVFEQLVPAGAVINEAEALVHYGMAAFMSGDLAKADDLADRLLLDAARRSVHTRSHALALKALVGFGSGGRGVLADARRDLGILADNNPDASFCLLSGAVVGYAAATDVLAGAPLPPDLDEQAKRFVDDSERVQAAVVMLPKAMLGDREAVPAGLRAYEPGLRLWDRNRVWDTADLLPAIALTILERWDELPPVLARLDEVAAEGARLAEAAASAIRQEIDAAKGGPPPAHEQLRDLGYAGFSQLISFRPVKVATPK